MELSRIGALVCGLKTRPKMHTSVGITDKIGRLNHAKPYFLNALLKNRRDSSVIHAASIHREPEI